VNRYHNVEQLTKAELERVKRELQANLGLIAPGSPAHVPIYAHMQAVDAELTKRSNDPAGLICNTSPVRQVSAAGFS
jgi:hypothetical protein